MTDTPKFEVIDRRKLKHQDEEPTAPSSDQHEKAPAPEPPSSGPQPASGPRLVTDAERRQVTERPETQPESLADSLPPAPSAEESSTQKAAYDASAQRVEDLIRAQNPGVGAQPPVTFDQLVQQLYVSGLIQMGAGTPEGQQPRVDILGARGTIDLMGVLAEKTKGNLNAQEEKMLQAALYELRMAFLEITGMISMPSVPPPPPAKR